MTKPHDESFDDAEQAHPLLTAKEVSEARARARTKIEDEKRKAALKKVEEDETQRLRMEEGLVTGNGPGDEMVSITIDLAEHSACINIDGQQYWHGVTYTRPRRIAATLQEIMYRGWQHQAEIDGKSKKSFYDAKRVAEVFKVKGGGTVLGAGQH